MRWHFLKAIIAFAFLVGGCTASVSVHAASFLQGDRTDLRAYMSKYEAMQQPGFKFDNATDAFQVGVLVGYIDGIAFALEGLKVICPPNIGLSSANHLDIVGRYLKKTPRTDKEVGAVLITAAFQEVFPCRR